MSGLKRYLDILLINTLVVIILLLVGTGWPAIIRIILGIPAVLFFPGHVLLSALFPRKNSLDRVERIALSIGASLAVVILIGLALNYTGVGITVISTTTSTGLFIIAVSVWAFLRRRSTASGFEPDLKIRASLTGWRNKAPSDRLMALALAAGIILALGTSIYVAARPKPGDSFTEFYLLNESRVAEKYIREMTAGKEYVLVLGIINREREDNRYRVLVTLDGLQKDEIGPLSLLPGEKREFEYRYRPDTLGDNQKLEFLLYRNNETEPCANLYLRIWVKPY